MLKNYDNMLSRFHRIPEHNGQTDRFAISISRVSMLVHDKNSTRQSCSYNYRVTGSSINDLLNGAIFSDLE